MTRAPLAIAGALALLLAAAPAGAQSGGPDAAGYSFTSIPYTWTEASSLPGRTAIAPGDDVSYGPYNLPFTFRFYDVNYTQFRISSNGLLTLGNTDAGSWCCNGFPLPSTGGPKPAIAAAWTDLMGGTIYYGIAGTAPNRRAVIQWNTRFYYSGPPVTAQAQLLEGSNELILTIASAGADGHRTVMGIQNQTGTTGLTALNFSNTAVSNRSFRFSQFVVSAGGPYTVREGGTVTLSASASQGTAPYTYSWDLDNDGTFGDATGASPTVSWSQLGGERLRTLAVRVSDAAGRTRTATTTVNVIDTPPIVTLTQVTTGAAGTESTFVATVTSVNPTDQAAGYDLRWSLGDGTSRVGRTTGGQGTVIHSYCRAGAFTVSVQAVDNDGLPAAASAAQQVANTPPVITSDAPTLAREGTPLQYVVQVDRPSCEPLTFSAAGPSGVAITQSGLLSWTPAYADVGPRTLTVTVADGWGGQAEQLLTLDVAFVDGDHDGLPDTWEVANGLDPTDPNTPFERTAGDGLTNMEKYQAGLDPQQSYAPGAIALASPADAAVLTSSTPTLEVTGPASPTTPLTYEFQVFADAALTQPLPQASGTAQGTGSASFTLPVALADHFTYHWRARATGSTGVSPWTAARSFRLDVVARPPGEPTPVSPQPGSAVATLQPELVIADGAWATAGTVTWHFEVYEDAGLTALIAEGDGLPGGSGFTAFTVGAPLQNGRWYHWRARGTGAGNHVGAYGPSASFRVLESATPLAAPSIASPLDGATVRGLRPTLVAAVAGDADGRPLSYTFTVDQAPTFDSAAAVTSGQLQATGAFVSWQPEAELAPHVTWYVRVTATDGATVSEAGTSRFWLNPANDAPTVPAGLKSELLDGNAKLTATASTDVDGDAITYDFEVRESEDGPVVARKSAVATPEATFSLAGLPSNSDTFVWRARAVDTSAANSGWSAFAELTLPRVEPAGCSAVGGASALFLVALAPLLRRRRK